MQNTTKAAIAAMTTLSVSAAHADMIDINLDPTGQANIDTPLFTADFGVSGSLGIEVETDPDGKLSNAGLCTADLLIQSAGTYNFGASALLRLTNIGLTLEEKGGQEYFYNETAGVPQPGDYAGFLDTDAIAAITGEFGIDLNGDGVEEITRDLATVVGEEFRTFDFEAIITRDGGSDEYFLTTDFILDIVVGFDGDPLPVSIQYSGGGSGFIPTPASITALAAVGLLGARRRR